MFFLFFNESRGIEQQRFLSLKKLSKCSPLLLCYLYQNFGENFVTIFQTLEEASPYSGFGKEEHFAMVAFQIGRVLDQKPNKCPLPEASSVLYPLRTQAETSNKSE